MMYRNGNAVTRQPNGFSFMDGPSREVPVGVDSTRRGTALLSMEIAALDPLSKVLGGSDCH